MAAFSLYQGSQSLKGACFMVPVSMLLGLFFQILHIHDRALCARACQLAVQAQPAPRKLRRRRFPSGTAGSQLLVADQNVQRALFNIDNDTVAIVNQRNGTAFKGLGGNMAHEADVVGA